MPKTYPSLHILAGLVDDFGDLVRACDMPRDVYMQRFNYFNQD
jgi:hypothetical protein